MKTFVRLIKQSWKNLFLRKSRTLMTSLGIIIGASTVVIVINIGLGSQESIKKQFSNMSVTSIMVMGPRGRFEGGSTKFDATEDLNSIMEASTNIRAGSVVLNGNSSVSWGNYASSFAIVGTNSDFENILNLEYYSGNFFTQSDEDQRKKVVVLGYNVADDLTNGDINSIIGSSVKINKKSYDIIGILKYRGGSVGMTSVDDSVYVPYSTAKRYIVNNRDNSTIQLDAVDVNHVETAIDEITELLRAKHKLSTSSDNDFQVRDMGQMINSAIESAKTSSYLLSSVGAIVLLVGGIGIMNVMYISVQERTKEIGIKKAIGAKKGIILTQFMIEAIMISTLAGLVGLVGAFFITKYLASTGFNISNSSFSYILGFIASVSVGIFFGYYPAKKASEMNPIEALRHE